MRKRIKPVTVGLALLLGGAFAQNLLPNPDFEKGLEGWGFFIPGESKDKGCQVTLAEGAGRSGAGVRFESKKSARWLMGAAKAFPVQPGDRYRVSVWVRMDPGSVVQKGTPGVAIRATMYDAAKKPADHPHVIPGGRTVSASEIGKLEVTVPGSEWERIAGEVTVPEGMTTLQLEVAGIYLQGSFVIDDASLEYLGKAVSTPVKSTTSQPPPSSTPEAALGFEKTGWTGGEYVQEPLRSGSWALRWEISSKKNAVGSGNLPKDWSRVKSVGFWVHSQKATGAKINVVLLSQKDPKVFSYYYGTFTVDFEGWKRIVLPTDKLSANREPAGWNQINNFGFDAGGWGNKIIEGTVLTFDEMSLSAE